MSGHAAAADIASRRTARPRCDRTSWCRDNALAGSFSSWLKGEHTDTRSWPTRAGAGLAAADDTAWYNGTRRAAVPGRRPQSVALTARCPLVHTRGWQDRNCTANALCRVRAQPLAWPGHTHGLKR